VKFVAQMGMQITICGRDETLREEIGRCNLRKGKTLRKFTVVAQLSVGLLITIIYSLLGAASGCHAQTLQKVTAALTHLERRIVRFSPRLSFVSPASG
jgi:hypothetical protein